MIFYFSLVTGPNLPFAGVIRKISRVTVNADSAGLKFIARSDGTRVRELIRAWDEDEPGHMGSQLCALSQDGQLS